ncbi:hypothetical protein PsorP6_017301 [Peronosclerospora sorghi]|uniref:Uncharacterized protein n=1 Tax=Peronosclerospora sorghi TaxID=230839 RepID=A0ACC0WMF4_9STRA|nr:hypothetical protein PsorP6_017301 [Peronosclerospora sorghi]
MKFDIVAAFAITLLSSQASAAVCKTSVLSALVTNPHVLGCAKDSGYAFAAPTIPDQPTIDKMCASTVCDSFLRATKAMDLEECQLPLGPGINLLADLIDYVPPKCPAASVMGAEYGTTLTTDAPPTVESSTNETRSSTSLTSPAAPPTSDAC